jgi:hypothetical protein
MLIPSLEIGITTQEFFFKKVDQLPAGLLFRWARGACHGIKRPPLEIPEHL